MPVRKQQYPFLSKTIQLAISGCFLLTSSTPVNRHNNVCHKSSSSNNLVRSCNSKFQIQKGHPSSSSQNAVQFAIPQSPRSESLPTEKDPQDF
jgi:hypothetical protein